MTKKKTAAKKTAAAPSQFYSLATGRPVTTAWAKRNPTKAVEGVTKLPKGAVLDTSIPGPTVETAVANVAVAKTTKKAAKKKAKKAVKKTRIVKRRKAGSDKGGEFAKATAKGKNVTADIIPVSKVVTKKPHVVISSVKGPVGMSAAAAKRAPAKKKIAK